MPNAFKHRIAFAVVFFFTICLTPFQGLNAAGGPETGTSCPKPLVTEHTILHYLDDENLGAFYTGITGHPDTDVSREAVGHAVDAIFARSQDLLGMHGFVNQIHIRIHPSKSALKHAFFKRYQHDQEVRAWYAHDELTIHVRATDVTAGILAHELAHAIIDHYMIVPPPSESAEILARYVDRHIHAPGKPEVRNDEQHQFNAYSN